MNSSYNRNPVEPASPIFKPTLKYSTSSDYLKSTAANVKNKETTLRPERAELSLKSCSEKKHRDRKTTSEQLKSRNCRTSRLLRKHSS